MPAHMPRLLRWIEEAEGRRLVERTLLEREATTARPTQARAGCIRVLEQPCTPPPWGQQARQDDCRGNRVSSGARTRRA